MPDELFVLLIILIACFTAITILKMILAHEKGQSGEKAAASADEASLTTSQLEKMLQRVVHQATEPLAIRLDAIEEPLDVKALPEAEARIELGDPAEVPAEPAMEPLRRRER